MIIIIEWKTSIPSEPKLKEYPKEELKREKQKISNLFECFLVFFEINDE